MTARVDEWAMNFYMNLMVRHCKILTKGAVDLGELTDENEKQEAKQAEEKKCSLWLKN